MKDSRSRQRRGAIYASLTAVSCTLITAFADSVVAQQVDEESLGSEEIITSEATPQESPYSSDAKIEEVFITGSLLPKGNYGSSAPIATITNQQFEINNTVNVEQLLNTMPQVLAGSDRSSTFGFGWATADLRGLGTNRTLSLMDGKRIVPSWPEGGTVDLNFIPPGLIDRIEILTGGASTAYGSDAMAGVINIITRDDFEGFELVLGGEITDQSDSEVVNVSGMWGTFFGEGRGHIMVLGDYSERQELYYPDRDFASPFNTEFFDSSGVSQGIVPFLFPVNGGTIYGVMPYGTSDGDVFPFNPVTEGFDPTEQFMLQVPQEREVLFSKARWDGDRFSIFGQIHLANTDTTRSFLPVPVFPNTLGGPVPITLENNPFITEQGQQTLASDPLIQMFGLDFNDNGIPDIANVFLGRVFEEFGPAEWTTDYEMRQYQLEGSFDLNDYWSVTAYVNSGEINADVSTDGAIDQGRLRQALLLDASGTACLDSSNGCVPANIYGRNTLSSEAVSFLKTRIPAENNSKLLQASVLVSGNTAGFFEMPGDAGPIGAALGYEYIKREQDFSVDPRVITGEVQTPGAYPEPLQGQITRNAVYGELVVPLLSGRKFADFLELELAARYTDYDAIDSTFSAKAAISYYPTPDIQLRASFNRAVRGASLFELYGAFGDQINLSGGEGFVDPCSADGAFLGASAETCVLTGVPSGAVGSSDLNIGAGNVAVNLFANPDLEAETGDTYSVGFVWTPYDLEGFSASVDYFQIKISDYIGRLPGFDGATSVEYCYFGRAGADPEGVRDAYCPQIKRDASGKMILIDAGTTNLATHDISGTDLSINYQFDALGGLVDLYFIGTYIDSKEYFVNPKFGTDCAGKFNSPLGGEACQRPVTRWKHRATANWSSGDLTVQLTWRNVSGVRDNDQSRQYVVEEVSSFDYFEVAASYEVISGLKVSGGVRNLTDEDPPVLGENSFEANTYPNIYDVYGRVFYGRLQYNF